MSALLLQKSALNASVLKRGAQPSAPLRTPALPQQSRHAVVSHVGREMWYSGELGAAGGGSPSWPCVSVCAVCCRLQEGAEFGDIAWSI